MTLESLIFVDKRDKKLVSVTYAPQQQLSTRSWQRDQSINMRPGLHEAARDARRSPHKDCTEQQESQNATNATSYPLSSSAQGLPRISTTCMRLLLRAAVTACSADTSTPQFEITSSVSFVHASWLSAPASDEVPGRHV